MCMYEISVRINFFRSCRAWDRTLTNANIYLADEIIIFRLRQYYFFWLRVHTCTQITQAVIWTVPLAGHSVTLVAQKVGWSEEWEWLQRLLCKWWHQWEYDRNFPPSNLVSSILKPATFIRKTDRAYLIFTADKVSSDCFSMYKWISFEGKKYPRY